MTNWQIDKLTNWQIDKLTNWQNFKWPYFRLQYFKWQYLEWQCFKWWYLNDKTLNENALNDNSLKDHSLMAILYMTIQHSCQYNRLLTYSKCPVIIYELDPGLDWPFHRVLWHHQGTHGDQDGFRRDLRVHSLWSGVTFITLYFLCSQMGPIS